MNNLLKMVLLGSLFIGTTYADSKQSASEAVSRLEGVKKVFAEKGNGALAFLNGLESGGSVTGKGHDENLELGGSVDNSNDPNAPLVCVGSDNTYIVHTANPSMVGKSAVVGLDIWKDDKGRSIIERSRQALLGSSGLTSIDSVKNNLLPNLKQGVKPNDGNYSLTVADERFFGENFPKGAFCATNAQAFEPLKNSDVEPKEKHNANTLHSKNDHSKHKEATHKTTATVKTKETHAVEKTKDAVAKAAVVAKDAANAVKTKVTHAVEKAKNAATVAKSDATASAEKK